MKAIAEWLYSTLADDTTLRTYLGGSASDPRVYFYFPTAENINKLTDTAGAIVTYYEIDSGGLFGDVIWALQEPDELYAVDVWSKVKSVMENAFERIDALLNEELQPSITGWKVARIHRVDKKDIPEPEDHMFRKHLEYNFHRILDAS